MICDQNLRFNFKFSIKEAERAHQPKIDPSTLKIEEVNDDCLRHIISHLDLIDIINFGKTSTRLQSVTQQVYVQRKHFSFGTNTGDSSVNEINLPIILEEIGSYIKSIEWTDLDSAHFDVLAKYCPNVTTLKLQNPKFGLSSVKLKINKLFFANLKRLHIISAPFYDTAIKLIVTSSKLISLKLDNCRNVHGKFLTKRKCNKLKHIGIINCRSMGGQYVGHGEAKMDDVTDFQRNNKLFTFSMDKCCSYLHCLTSPAEILAKFKQLELDFSCFLDSQLEQLNFKELKRLTKFTITRKHRQFLHPPGNNSFADFANFNKVFTAMSQIDTLVSLNVANIEIDINTLKCLGAIKNLKQLRLINVRNSIGKQMYTTMHDHLPNLNELSMSFEISAVEKAGKWICDMIILLPQLRYFSHSSMNWGLLDKISKSQLSRNQLPIRIGITNILFVDPKKVTNVFIYSVLMRLLLCHV